MSRAAIVGVGQTAFSRGTNRSEWDLAIEAIQAALDDAGLAGSDVNGVVHFTADAVDAAMITRTFGATLSYYGLTPYGGLGATSVVAQAAAAVDGGLADVVVGYRALKGYSKTRMGRAERSLGTSDGETIAATGDRAPSGAFAGPYGLLAPGQVMAMWARRYQHEWGLSEDQLVDALCRIAVDQRTHARTNPQAIMRDRPLDRAMYLSGRPISSPLRLYDYALESDGAAAVIVARDDLRRLPGAARPVAIRGSCQPLPAFGESVSVYGELRNSAVYQRAARRMYDSAGCLPTDIDVALLYEATTPTVLLAYEAFGFASPGQGWKSLARDGLGMDSPLPINPHGGHLSEAYVHGMNHITEAVRQCRGVAANQVSDMRLALVTSGPSALILEAG